MYDLERSKHETAKHWFEDYPHATTSQMVRWSKEQQAIFEVLRFVCWLVLLLLLWTALRGATLWTNQMGYMTLVAQLPWIYGDVNRPCPRATPSDSVGLLP